MEHIVALLVIGVLSTNVVLGNRYHRDQGGSRRTTDCPVQCRCIHLSHLGYRDMAQRWETMGRLHGTENTVWKGTPSPVWMESPNELQGRDVVCMGLNKIPRPLPTDVTKLTMFGDSSDMAEDNVVDAHAHAQITSLRDTSFVTGLELKELTISGNNVEILYPFIFRNLPNLLYLALQSNNIRHISAAAFNGLEILKELKLSDNIIRSMSPNTFTGVPNLRFLYLNGNKLSIIHLGLFRKLKNLEYLDLSRNNFRHFHDEDFDGIVNLQELLINENRLWTIKRRWFENLHALKILELRGNAITRIDPSSFSALHNLEQLSLSANAINTVSNGAFKNVLKLRTLDIAANDINNLEPDCFAGLDSLDELDLSTNRLYFINNKTFTATPTLRKLDLSRNAIKDIEEAALHPLAALQELDLSNNKLKRVEGKTFTGLLELKEVNLENNIISEIEDDAFIVASLNQLSKITWLSVQFNRITSLSAYSLFGLPHLKFLNLGHNKIRTIDTKAFYSLSSLQNVLLNNNRIKHLGDDIFSNLKLLYSLSLENNKLSSISDHLFVGLTNLDDINLMSNAIDAISPNALSHFSALTRLQLSGNLLSEFAFPGLIFTKKLKHVDLSNNRLYNVEFPSEHTHDLYHLDLSGNNLRTLSPDMTYVLSPAGNLWLKDNPWSCDCELTWLVRNAAEYRIRVLGSRDTVCTTPSDLYGERMMSLPLKKFRCDNTTLSEKIVCQNLQIKVSSRAQEPIRNGKQETRQWHVTFFDNTNTTNTCYGFQLSNNWVVTSNKCMQTNIPNEKSKVKVKVGRRESREIALSVDYKNTADVADFDVRLVRLVAKQPKSTAEMPPCILSHDQYYQLSHFIPEAAFTARAYVNKTGKWRLVARRGKIVPKCHSADRICLNVKGDTTGMNLQGSPLSLRYQGIWYSVGLGVNVNATDHHQQLFTPLWRVADWMATAMHEIDTKCRFQTMNGIGIALCEGLAIPGVVGTKTFV